MLFGQHNRILQHITSAHSALILLCILLVVSLSLFGLGLYQPHVAKAAFNPQINYQGKLTDTAGGAVPDGTYNMRFWLLTSPSIATTSAEWTESLTGTNRVQVTNGLFSVMLGSTSPLTSVNFNQTLYLGVEIGSTTATAQWDGEMSPRKILGTVPAAFEAQRLGGASSTQYLRSDEPDEIASTSASTLLTITQSGTGDILNLFGGGQEVFTVTDTGNVGIGSSTPSSLLTVAGEAKANYFTAASSTATSTFYDLRISDTHSLLFGDDDDGIAIFQDLAGIGANDLFLKTRSNTSGYDITISASSSLSFASNAGPTGAGTYYPSLSLNNNGSVQFVNTTQGTAGNRYFEVNMTDGARITTGGLRIDVGTLAVGTTSASATAHILNTGSGNSFRVDDVLGDASPFIINANGNVGIGSTSPNAKLTIEQGQGGTGPLFQIASSSNGTATSTHFMVDAFGNVGLGTNANSSYGLSIGEGDWNIEETELYIYIAGDRSWRMNTSYFSSDNNQGPKMMNAQGALDDPVFVVNGNDLDTGIGGDGSGNVSLVTNGVASLVASSSGNIGIGTTSPNAKLSVKGSGTGSGLLAQFTDSADSPKVTILDNGNVGIGTTSPLAPLHVMGNIIMENASNGLYYRDGGGTNRFLIGLDSGTLTVGGGDRSIDIVAKDHSAEDISFFAGSNETVTIKNSGNVGIGTSSPGYKLQVVGDIGLSGVGGISTVRLHTSTDEGLVVKQTMNVTNGNSIFSVLDENDNNRFLVTEQGNVGIGTTSPAGTLHVSNASSTNALVVADSGNIGIGTTSPAAKLQVHNTVATSDAHEVARFSLWDNQNIDERTAGYQALYLMDGNQSYEAGRMQWQATDVSSGGSLSFWTSNSGTLGQRVTIDNSGNVGIGTTTPTTLLTVGSSTLDKIAAGELYRSTFISGELEVDGLAYLDGGITTGASSTIQNLTFTNATGTALVLGTDRITDLTGSGLYLSGNALTASITPSVVNAIDTAGAGECLTYETAGSFEWTSCGTGSGGGTWSTTTQGARLVNYSNNDTDIVAIGANATTSAEYWFDPSNQIAYLSGLVGIGTSSPASTLDVWGDFRVGTSSTPTLFADVSTSRVGVGTSTPVNTLHVVGNETGIVLKGENTSAAGFGGVAAVNDTGEFGQFGIGGSSASFGQDVTFVRAGASDGIITLYQNTAERLVVDSTGYVGIGTTSPEDLLHVDGGNIRAQNSGAGSAFIANREDGKSVALLAGGGGSEFLFDSSGFFAVEATSEANVLSATGGTGAQVFKIDGSASENSLVVNSSSNVGLGTSSPNAKLTVEQGPNGSGTLFQIASSSDGTATTTHFIVDQFGSVGVNAGGIPQAIFGQGRTSGISSIIVGSEYVQDKGIEVAYDNDNNRGRIHLLGDGGAAGINFADGGNVGIGTTTPTTLLTVGSSTATHLTAGELYRSALISGELEVGQLGYFNSGFLSYGSSTIIGGLTIDGDATTTGELIVEGTGTTTIGGTLDVNGSGTSTFAGGIKLEGGCFMDTSGTCVTSGGTGDDTVVVVAANDSPATEKAAADYVADGVNDEDTIQSAIDYAYNSGTGGTVYLLSGQFNIHDQIDLATSTRLIGQGTSTRLRLINSAANNIAILSAVRAHHTYVGYLQLEGNRTNNLTFDNQNGVTFTNTSSSTIEHVTANNFQDHGFLFTNSHNNTVTHVTGNNNEDYGIFFSSGGENTNHNTVSNSETKYNGGNGIALSGSNNVVTGSMMSENGSYGIITGGSNNIISSNQINGNTSNGITINSGNYIVISDNQIDGNRQGVLLNSGSNVLISGNLVKNSRNSGIVIEPSSNSTVAGNTLSGNGNSGVFASIDINGADDNVISNNNIYATSTDPLIDINSTSDRNVIVGNQYENPDTTTYVTDANGTTRYNEWDRTTITTDDERGYSLFTINGSSSAALASTTQWGTGDILSLGNSSGRVFTIDNSGNVGIGTTTPTTLLTVGSSTATHLTGGELYRSALISGELEVGQLGYFNSGFLAYGSSTIIGGLTIDGNATTTGELTVEGTGTTTIGGTLDVNGSGTSTFAGGIQLEAGCFRDASGTCVGGGDDTVVVVAANNSSATEKGAADYIANGTNDQDTINTALAALPATGGVVHLLEGTYSINNTITINATGTVLTGAGASTLLEMTASSTSWNMIEATNISEIEVSHLKLDGANGSGATMYGISFDGVASSTIAQVTVQNLQDHGIYLTSSANNTLTGNQVSKNGPDGIYLSSSSNNTLSGNQVAGNANVGIFLGSSSNNNTFTSNQVTDNSYGIWLSSSANNTLSGNQVAGNSSYGIVLESSSNNTLSGNQATDNSYGIYLSSSANNTLSGNQVAGNSQRGIYVNSSANNTLSGNQVTGNSYGIWLSSSANNTITGNTLSGNGHTGAYASIFLAGTDSDDNVISSNNIYATGTDPLIEIENDGTHDRNLLVGNVYENPDSTDYVLDGGVNTRYNEWDRTTITTDDERGYDLFTINGSSSSSTINVTQQGTGDILSLGNSSGRVFTIDNSGNVGIGSTTPTANLTVQGTAGQNADLFAIASSTGTKLLTVDSGGQVGLGTTTPDSLLSLYASGTTGSVIAGVREYFNFTNATQDAVYYGDNAYIVNAPTATSTLVGDILRVEDNSTLGNLVRGLEVQAHKGSNTKGENTALSGFARTFGVRGTTEGDAGGSYEPAGLFGETRGTTQGNAIRGYSGTITTGDLMSLFHDGSAFEGTGLLMDFGNAGGSFAATSSAKFADFKNQGTSVFTVTAGGTTTIGDGSTKASVYIPYGGICVDDDGDCLNATSGVIGSVSTYTGHSDLAEIYFSSDTLETGEIVAASGGLAVGRADRREGSTVIGVVSTKPGVLMGEDDTALISGNSGYPIALKGRVPVKLSTEGGPIVAGDPITLSSIPGVGMKATTSSVIVGYALEDFTGEAAYTEGFLHQFGDDLADITIKEREEVDPRTQDGCYYGGGSALGEEECEPGDVSVLAEEETTISTTTEAEEQEAERQAVLDEFAAEDSEEAMLANGETVAIGKGILFVHLSWSQPDTITNILAELNATATTIEGHPLADEEEAEATVWERLKDLASRFVDGVLTVLRLDAKEVYVKERLCIDDVCVTADDLRAMLENTSGPATTQSDGDTTATDTETTTANSTTATTADSTTDSSGTESGTSTDTSTNGETDTAASSTASTTSSGTGTTTDAGGSTTTPTDTTESTEAVGTSTTPTEQEPEPDITAPVITLNGDSSVELEVDGSYNESGVTAYDEIDGDLTSEVTTTGEVDTSTEGSYTIEYSVSDTSGNTATETREVLVATPPEPTQDPTETTQANTETASSSPSA